MGKSWTRLTAVFVVFAILQGHVFIDRAFGEARMPESRGATETIVTEKRELPESSAAAEQEVTPPETTDGSMRQSSYVFKPKVCSAYMEEIFGKTMCETWFHLVDAVLAGEDTFACPDQHTYDWVMGLEPIHFRPRCLVNKGRLRGRVHFRVHSGIVSICNMDFGSYYGECKLEYAGGNSEVDQDGNIRRSENDLGKYISIE